MSGPLTFKVTDRTSMTSPPHAVKDWPDTSMVVFDFTSWLGTDPTQYLAFASDVLFQTNPQQNAAGVWIPFPGGCCSGSQADVPPPEDVNPITLQGLTILPGGKKVELSLGAGTPGLAYLATFIAAAGPYARRKEVGVVMTCFALRPFTGVVLPPPPPIIAIGGGGSTTLPVGSSGTVNINNVSGAPITITLPLNPVIDQSLKFKDIGGNAGTYNITILAPVPATIDGFPSYHLVADYMAIEIYWMGTQWGTR